MNSEKVKMLKFCLSERKPRSETKVETQLPPVLRQTVLYAAISLLSALSYC